MGNFEYRDLAPIDNIENGDKYIEALNWAFQNKKVKNIALTGPYGAGKSSVIETFLAQDDEKNNKKGFYSICAILICRADNQVSDGIGCNHG